MTFFEFPQNFTKELSLCRHDDNRRRITKVFAGTLELRSSEGTTEPSRHGWNLHWQSLPSTPLPSRRQALSGALTTTTPTPSFENPSLV